MIEELTVRRKWGYSYDWLVWSRCPTLPVLQDYDGEGATRQKEAGPRQ